MGFKDITAGDKVATPIAIRFIESKGGKPGVEVAFDFIEPSTGGKERINWTGWISESATKFTMETLVNVLGYNGSEVCGADGVLTDPQAINFEKQVKLVVEIEQYEGKSYPRVKWVNTLGGSAFAGLKPEVIKSKLAGSGFKAAFLAAKQQVAPLKNHYPQFHDEESVPF